MQDIREIEFRDSGSNANTKVCFEVRATTLRSRLHTEGFSLRLHRTSHKGTSTEEFTITNLEYTTPLSTQPPILKRQGTKPKLNHPYTRGMDTKPNYNHLYTRGTRHKAKTPPQTEVFL